MDTTSIKTVLELIGKDVKTINDRINDLIQSLNNNPIGDTNVLTNEISDIKTLVGIFIIKTQELSQKIDTFEHSTDSSQLNSLTEQINNIASQLPSLQSRLTDVETTLQNQASTNGVTKEWTQAFTGAVKLAEYTTNALCTLPMGWKELRVEYKFKASTQSEYKLMFNDINSSARKAYTLGTGVGDIVIDVDGTLKCFAVVEPNVRILGVYYK